MPELPEVETIRHDLSKKVINKKITSVLVKKSKIIRGSIAKFKKTLISNSFKKISRIGKLLIFELKDSNYLLIHLKMTGQLIYVKDQQITAGGHSEPNQNFKLPNKHTHIIFNFSDHSQLFYNDLRQFGYLEIVNQQRKKEIVISYGPEPGQSNFTFKYLQNKLKKHTINIKKFLMDQKNIAGIGNIYADEILWRAGIRPTRPANKLTETEIKKLFSATHSVLKLAIKHRGTTFNNYVDGAGQKGNFTRLLKVYGRSNQNCVKCKSRIKKIKSGGRGTHFCPVCQK